MGIIDEHEHQQCFYFDSPEKPTVELVRIANGSKGDLNIRHNEVVFFMEGRLRFIFNDLPDYEGMKGQMLFLPAGGHYSFQALVSTTVIVFRIDEPIRFCYNFSVEKLYKSGEDDTHKPHACCFGALEINTRIWHFLDGISDCLNDGVRCRSFFDLKIKEFFLLLRMYYSKEDIYDFLYLILSGDTAFSEYVRLRWHRFRNVEEFADSMHMTTRQFSTKFKTIFGQTAYNWMKERRTKIVYEELITTSKPVKQVAFENGFGTVSQFTKFCKKELGKTPTDIRSGKIS